MITQREMDTYRVEAQQIVRELYEEWQRSYLGRRARENARRQRIQDGEGASEYGFASETETLGP